MCTTHTYTMICQSLKQKQVTLLKASQIPLAYKRVETKFLPEVKCILESHIRMMYNKAPSLEEASWGRGSIEIVRAAERKPCDKQLFNLCIKMHCLIKRMRPSCKITFLFTFMFFFRWYLYFIFSGFSCICQISGFLGLVPHDSLIYK